MSLPYVVASAQPHSAASAYFGHTDNVPLQMPDILAGVNSDSEAVTNLCGSIMCLLKFLHPCLCSCAPAAHLLTLSHARHHGNAGFCSCVSKSFRMLVDDGLQSLGLLPFAKNCYLCINGSSTTSLLADFDPSCVIIGNGSGR